MFEDPSLISVATSLDRDSLHPGDTLRITVTATNPTDQRVRVRLSDCGCGCEGGPAFEVRTPDGAVVDGPTGGGCFLLQPEPGELELGPGQAESAEFIWTAQKVQCGGDGCYDRSVTPGGYFVVGLLPVWDREALESDPIPIVILPVLTLNADVDPPVAAVGDAVNVHVAVTNETNRAVTIPAFSSCRFGVWVMRGDAVVDFLTDCSTADPEVTLGPKERLEGLARWRASEAGEYEILVQLVWREQPRLRALAALQVN
ncbi:MAG: hypothetical protein JSV41_03285 [Gemmatimonadota bacterium]|nr:MAG: hypothetical protein JSV41_03285 [Gemmatimonadota bacterium]